MTDQSHFFPLAPQDRRRASSAGRAVFKSQSQWLAEAEAQAAVEAAARAEARAARRAAAEARAAEARALEQEAHPVATSSPGTSPGAQVSLPSRLREGVGGGPEREPERFVQPEIPTLQGGEATRQGGEANQVRDDGMGGDEIGGNEPESGVALTGEALPAATNSACGSASLAPLPQTGGGEVEDDEHLTKRTPPPRKPGKPRHSEWTRQKMALFLRELAASQSVAQAARSVGMSRQSAYRLRARLVGTPFALGWEVALEAGLAQLAHAMMDRAVNGVEVPHYHGGELVGTSRRYDERLSIWLMSNPWKVGRQQIAREYSAEGFDRLLERIEIGPLDWGGLDDAGDGDGDIYAEETDAAACSDGPPDQLPGLFPPAATAEEAGERQTAFMNTRSWYGGGAGESSREERRWRGR